MSHRALILAAMAQGVSTIRGLLISDDVMRTASAIQAFGAVLHEKDGPNWSLSGVPWHSPETLIDCGNSGTAARLLMGAAAGQDLAATFTGDHSLRHRPMAGVIKPLVGMGAKANGYSHLPITLRGGGLKGTRYRTEFPSAQIKSAILLAGLNADGEVEVTEPAPSRDHTERMLRFMGCDVDVEDRRTGHVVRLGQNRILTARDLLIPGDPSSAAFAIVAALITRASEIKLEAVLDSPMRSGLIETLIEMGADIAIHNRRSAGGVDIMDVSARSSALRGVCVPAARAPAMIDEYPILSIAAAFASGETRMEGLSQLRVKESDRLSVIQQGLVACGIEAQIDGDALRVVGLGTAPEGGAQIATYGDHRIAMSFLVLGLGARQPVSVDEAPMIATSFPNFAEFMGGLGAEIVAC
jgi:3-phosphoshikimate 1-carboxyvinyltransferase